MKEEQMKLNKNLGFGFSAISPEVGKDIKKVNGSNVEESLTEQSSNPDLIGKIKPEISSVIPKSCIDDSKSGSTDPWYSAYEAKKAEAVENLKSANLKSVSGSSGIVGKIEGVVDHLTKNNEVTKLMNRLKQEDPKTKTDSQLMKMESSNCGSKDKKTDSKPTLCQPRFAESDITTSTASSLSPPPPPRQLLQLSLPASLTDEPSSPPSDRPSRPSVPTPGKYGTLYGGAPSPGPNPNRSFQPPGFVPPTPPANMAKRRPWPDSQAGAITHSKDEEKKDSMQSLARSAKADSMQSLARSTKADSKQSLARSAKADSKLSTNSWQEEYLARKKARLGDS